MDGQLEIGTQDWDVIEAMSNNDTVDDHLLADSESGNKTADLDGEDVTAAASRQLWLSPVPEWGTARPVWGKAWPFHQYFFASMFLCLFLATCYFLLRFYRQRKTRDPKRPTGRLNRRSTALLPPPVLCLIAVATFLRALCLYLDPYGSEKRMPVFLARTLGNLPFTCFLCAYQLIFLALRSSIRAKMNSLSWLENRVLLAVVVVGFMIFNTLVDLVLALVVQWRALLLICMVANTLWMGTIVAELLYITYQIQQHMGKWSRTPEASRRDRTLSRESAPLSPGHDVPGQDTTSPMKSSQPQAHPALPRRFSRMSTGFRAGSRTASQLTVSQQQAPAQHKSQFRIKKTLMYMTAAALLYMSILFYYFLGVSGAVSFQGLISPWPWYAVATLRRLVDILQVLVLLRAINLASSAKRPTLSPGRKSFLWSWRSQNTMVPQNESRARPTVDVSETMATGRGLKPSHASASDGPEERSHADDFIV